MTKGLIFDIQKFALHDGPGIRTAVFLKGCALRCQWCCNPESQLPTPQLSFDRNRCNDCNDCVPACNTGSLTVHEGKLKVNFNACNACCDCLDECSRDALKICGKTADAEGIVDEVVKDKAYFDNSGGGITLTGGDPLFQPDFAAEILHLSKNAGLHTCLETAGDYPREDLMKVVKHTDLILYDFKHYSESDHLKYTGVSNHRILDNLDFLCKAGKEVILRCPVIPGVNNTIEHFRAITDLSRKYDEIIQVELMPFHDYGFHKYEQTGMKRPSINSSAIPEKTKKMWIKQMKELGCRKIKEE
ncbi:MAG: glycyl-radical enzyme activating protein [Bacteroidales bacterium]